MSFNSSPLNARPSNLALSRYLSTAFRPARHAPARKALNARCSSSSDPWKTLGVSYDADDKQIKKAYRKLALDNHPDLRGSEAAGRFVKIQEAYEEVTGKRRGTIGDTGPRSSTAAAGWDFHDWYWKFTAGKRWDQQRKKAPHSPAAEAARLRPTGAPSEALRAQLAGLRRKAAFRARSRSAASAHQPGDAATNAAGEFTAEPRRTAKAEATAFESSTGEAERTSVGHDKFAESQLAGLKRRAKKRQQQQQEAASAPSHSAASQTLQHTVKSAAAATEELHGSLPAKHCSPDYTAAAAVKNDMQSAASAPGAEEEPAWRGQLRCARDFMAEVRQRSTSSNIVAATFTGLRARLAPTIAHLAHRGETAAAADPRAVPDACASGAGYDQSRKQRAGSGGGRAAAADDGCGCSGSAQLGQQLASQLAGLKRRAAIREYPA